MDSNQLEKYVEDKARSYADNLHSLNCHTRVWQAARQDWLAGYVKGLEHGSMNVIPLLELLSGVLKDGLLTNELRDQFEVEIKKYKDTASYLRGH